MKKLFTLIAAAMVAVVANAQVITFTEPVAKGEVDGKSFGEGFSITVTDTDAKCEIDANNAYFGVAGENVKFTHRLKSGGKSSAKNTIAVTFPSAGTFKICARTGSNGATDRNVVVTQGEAELLNHIMLESEAVTEDYTDEAGEAKTRNVYPVLSCTVAAGEAAITYPVGSINFYAFEFVPADATSINAVSSAAISTKKVVKNGQVVIESAKGTFGVNGINK